MIRSPRFGVGRRGSPRFVPISPFSSRSLFSGIPRFVPICSDLLRFPSDLFSEQIRTNQGNPFLPTPFANPQNDTDQTHANWWPHTWVRPAMQEQTRPNLYPLAGHDCRLTYSNGAVPMRVGLELADHCHRYHYQINAPRIFASNQLVNNYRNNSHRIPALESVVLSFPSAGKGMVTDYQ